VTSAIETLLCSGTLVGLSEQELLERFVRQGDRRAFEAIVARHGPLVLTICQQILADVNDVEDAFQATFLVLIRRARSVRRPGSLASWLHGVAYRIALRIKRGNRPGRLLHDPPGRQSPCPLEEREGLAILHQEIDRLPPKYRLPIVLCYLEGMTHDSAATQLHWPVGTVRGRLARARDHLRERLARREVTLASGFMEAAWLDQAPLSETQIQSALNLFGNSVSTRISHLVQGALTAMLFEKMKWITLIFTTACFVVLAAGSGLVASARTGTQDVSSGPVVQVEQERRVPDFQKPVPVPQPESPDPRRMQNAARERDLEARADTLEEQRVKAEVLEIETGFLKQEIKQLVTSVNQYETTLAHGGKGPFGGFSGFGGGVTPNADDLAAYLKTTAENLKIAKSELEQRQPVYLKKRLELARLKRQIARGSKDLDHPVGDKADLAELNQRLGALETKVEKILERLSKEQ
jgi:RNA polymerase sigma factor (sigma-70 family)